MRLSGPTNDRSVLDVKGEVFPLRTVAGKGRVYSKKDEVSGEKDVVLLNDRVGQSFVRETLRRMGTGIIRPDNLTGGVAS